MYGRATPGDRKCFQQIKDLQVFATRSGFWIVDIVVGNFRDNKQRQRILKFAQDGLIDAVLVTDLNRFAKSTTDLVKTLQRLHKYNVAVHASNGDSLDLSVQAVADVISMISRFEKQSMSERTKLGMFISKTCGRKLGRHPAQFKMIRNRAEIGKRLSRGESYRKIAKELQTSFSTISEVVKDKESRAAKLSRNND